MNNSSEKSTAVLAAEYLEAHKKIESFEKALDDRLNLMIQTAKKFFRENGWYSDKYGWMDDAEYLHVYAGNILDGNIHLPLDFIFEEVVLSFDEVDSIGALLSEEYRRYVESSKKEKARHRASLIAALEVQLAELKSQE